MKYIDIHSHVNFKAFDEDREAVMARAKEAGVVVINVGTQIDTSRKAVEMANQFEHTYAIIGLHPIHTGASYHDEKELGEGGKESTRIVDFGDATESRAKGASPKFTTGFTSRGETFVKDIYREMLKNSKVVGIGECGLDYYHVDEDSIEKQKKDFVAQIELANETDRALMMHIRNNNDPKMPSAYMEALEILKIHYKPKDGIVRADSHFFAGNMAEAQALLDFGCTLSFTGAITYPPKKDGSGTNYAEIIAMTPMDRIMTETDCPYVAPVPYRGKKNEPSYVLEIVKKIAEIKGLPEEEVAKQIMVNAKRIFMI